MKGRGPAAGLTDRQRQVLELISRGKTNFEIANTLGITLDGAKWHVREIMAKLSCDTREEAVAIWRTRPPATVRLRGLAVQSLGFVVTRAGKIAIAATACAAIALGATLLVATMRPDRDVSRAEQVATTALDSDSGREQGEVISFRSCGTSQFARPTVTEMADVFQNARFGGAAGNTSLRPAPPYFAYYLKGVYQIVPRAISANTESVALSGANHPRNQNTVVLVGPATPCDQAFRQDRTLNFYEFWFIDMIPKSVHLQDMTLTIRVDLLPGSLTDVILPDPPVPVPVTPTKDVFNGLPPFKELRVMNDETILYSQGVAGTAQYASDGRLVFATNAFGGDQIEFEIRERTQTIAIFAQASLGLRAVEVTDAAGRVWTSDHTLVAPTTWSEVFRRELPVGSYRFEGGPMLVVPTDSPLP